MLCCFELGDGVVDLDEELKRSGESISGKEEKVLNINHTQCTVFKMCLLQWFDW